MITIIIINIIKITLMMMMMIKVLSYMEDHLKNKQRLEQEWVGLCAYEAEPNSTAIAFKVCWRRKGGGGDGGDGGLCAYGAEPNSNAIAFKVMVVVGMFMVDTMIVLLMKAFTKTILLLLQFDDDDHWKW